MRLNTDDVDDDDVDNILKVPDIFKSPVAAVVVLSRRSKLLQLVVVLSSSCRHPSSAFEDIQVVRPTFLSTLCGTYSRHKTAQ